MENMDIEANRKDSTTRKTDKYFNDRRARLTEILNRTTTNYLEINRIFISSLTKSAFAQNQFLNKSTQLYNIVIKHHGRYKRNQQHADKCRRPAATPRDQVQQERDDGHLDFGRDVPARSRKHNVLCQLIPVLLSIYSLLSATSKVWILESVPYLSKVRPPVAATIADHRTHVVGPQWPAARMPEPRAGEPDQDRHSWQQSANIFLKTATEWWRISPVVGHVSSEVADFRSSLRPRERSTGRAHQLEVSRVVHEAAAHDPERVLQHRKEHRDRPVNITTWRCNGEERPSQTETRTRSRDKYKSRLELEVTTFTKRGWSQKQGQSQTKTLELRSAVRREDLHKTRLELRSGGKYKSRLELEVMTFTKRGWSQKQGQSQTKTLELRLESRLFYYMCRTSGYPHSLLAKVWRTNSLIIIIYVKLMLYKINNRSSFLRNFIHKDCGDQAGTLHIRAISEFNYVDYFSMCSLKTKWAMWSEEKKSVVDLQNLGVKKSSTVQRLKKTVFMLKNSFLFRHRM
ncbi:unnamed protein product [Leptidea sinapis]|uniref:Uncharacterized protein n=1 Tax=Leptidea sinapis TaxID=189913 RepID=A0A5E4QJN2_9NEOP|nr:unnamed protein product [Leptidea sinapis]